MHADEGRDREGAATSQELAKSLISLGERDGIRTHDLLIKSQMLYQLSYALLDHDDFGLNQSKVINVIDSNN